MIRKYHNHKLQTNPWHREEEPHSNHETPGRQSKATSSLFPIDMIAKLEWTQSIAQQNIEQLQNPTMGVTINNRTSALERTAAKATGGLNAFYWYNCSTRRSWRYEPKECILFVVCRYFHIFSFRSEIGYLQYIGWKHQWRIQRGFRGFA